LLAIDDTIAAVASAAGAAARGIVRVAGPGAIGCAERLFEAENSSTLGAVRRPFAVPGVLRLPGFFSPCPAVAWCWPGPRSYTRQPTVELHLPGSPPLVAATLEAVCAAGARLARPGDFTLRAFLAGRLDLTQAEAVLGVIDAADRRGLSVALRQLAGGLAGPLADLRGQLLDLLAHLEAGLDFAEEGVEFISRAELCGQLAAATEHVHRLAEQVQTRADSRALPRVVLVGRPNVGKSSLFNALAGAAALVSPIAGTTRDALEAEIDLDGVACRLCDTAGADAATDGIGGAAQRQRLNQEEAADIVLLCLEAGQTRTAWELERLAISHVVVLTKCDLREGEAPAEPSSPLARREPRPSVVRTSAATGQGQGELRSVLREAMLGSQPAGEVVPATAVRARESLRQAADSLARASALAADAAGEELVAAEIRVALTGLGEVTGAVYTDDILDRIFSRFCIGK
jgi:tRNA modification GTPase